MNDRVFIGSSSEAKAYAQDLAQLLREESPSNSIEVLGWWEPRAFPAGLTILESISDALQKTNAAILLATPDDIVNKRDRSEIQPRNNVILEYGMFAALHGRSRVALAVLSKPELPGPSLPSDLSGLNYIPLEYAPSHSDFRERNRVRVRNWLEQLSDSPPPTPQYLLPRLYQTMLDVAQHERSQNPAFASTIDSMLSDMLVRMSDLHPGSNIINEWLVAQMQLHLQSCRSIGAVDVMGPTAWLAPSVYRYLSLQIRRYLRANTSRGRFNLVVSPELGDALERGCNAAINAGLDQSRSDFDAQDDLNWTRGRPKVEFARILLWTPEELMNPITESLIAIHEAFHVPLFYKEAAQGDPMREVDLLIFRTPAARIEGFFGCRTREYKTHPLNRGHIEGHGSADQYFKKLLADPSLMFAVDKREILKTQS